MTNVAHLTFAQTGNLLIEYFVHNADVLVTIPGQGQGNCKRWHMEQTFKTMAQHLSLLVEGVAALVIALGLLQFLLRYLPSQLKKEQYRDNTDLRVRFGSSLTIALELMLAADILQTAIAPTWEDIGKLAAIATIRTFLNYFLEKELRQIEAREKRQTPPIPNP